LAQDSKRELSLGHHAIASTPETTIPKYHQHISFLLHNERFYILPGKCLKTQSAFSLFKGRQALEQGQQMLPFVCPTSSFKGETEFRKSQTFIIAKTTQAHIRDKNIMQQQTLQMC